MNPWSVREYSIIYENKDKVLSLDFSQVFWRLMSALKMWSKLWHLLSTSEAKCLPFLPQLEEQNVKNMLNRRLCPFGCSLVHHSKVVKECWTDFKKWSFLTFTKVLNIMLLVQEILLVERIRQWETLIVCQNWSSSCDLAVSVYLFSHFSSEAFILWCILGWYLEMEGHYFV